MNSDLSPDDLYHVGVVVADIDEAAERLSAVGGYRWTKRMEYTVPVIAMGEPMDIPFTLVYSIEGPHIELVQEVPGTPWVSASRNAVHHLGYWSDDVEGTGAELERAGYVQEVRAAGSVPPMFAYYLDPLGVRIELVNRRNFGDWPAFLESMAR